MLRRELDATGVERDRLLRELGEAAYRRDGGAVEALRLQVAELDRRQAALGEEFDRTVLAARERMSTVQLETASTEIVQPGPDDRPKQ